jgi:hypothetical protein
MTPTKSPTKPSKSLGIQLRRDIGLYTVEDMCALLDVSAHTLMSWRNSGDGPVFTYLGGRRIYYRPRGRYPLGGQRLGACRLC